MLLIDEWKGRGECKKDLAVRKPKVSTVVGKKSCCGMVVGKQQLCQFGLVMGLWTVLQGRGVRYSGQC